MEVDLDIEIIITFFFFALKLIRTILCPIFSIIYRKKSNKLPPIEDEVLQLPALELAKRIRNQKTSAITVVRLFIERIRLVNPLINAVVDNRFDDALRDAKIADQMVLGMPAHYLKKHFPLLGVPFSVKESIGVRSKLSFIYF